MFAVVPAADASFEGNIFGKPGNRIEIRLPAKASDDATVHVRVSDLDVQCDDDLSSPTEPIPKGGALHEASIDPPRLTARMNVERAFEGDRYRRDGSTETYIEVAGHRLADGRLQGHLIFRTLMLATESSPGSTCYSNRLDWRAKHRAPARRGPQASRGSPAPRHEADQAGQQQLTTSVADHPEASIRFAVARSANGQGHIHFEPRNLRIRCAHGRTVRFGTPLGTIFNLDQSGRFRRVSEYSDEYGGWLLFSLHGEVRSDRNASGTLLVMSHDVNPFGGPQYSCTSDGPLKWSARR
jgi:hypothetical protein